jgi:protein ImuA
MPMPHLRSDLLARLRDEIEARERPAILQNRSSIKTDISALDVALPARGIRPGSLVELLAERSGSGAETVAVLLARAVCGRERMAVVLDREHEFYPPAAAAWGLALDQLAIVRAENEADELWAADLALRSRAVGAVWFRRDRLRSADFRRLQLAAEEGGAVGLLLRPAGVRGQPTWAEVQLWVQPIPPSPLVGEGWGGGGGRRLRIEVTRCRGGIGKAVEVELDDVDGSTMEVGQRETLPLSAFRQLADSAADGRSAGVARPSRPHSSARRAAR